MASSLFLLHRTVTLAGVMTSIFGGAARHFTTTRPNAFECSAARCGTSSYQARRAPALIDGFRHNWSEETG